VVGAADRQGAAHGSVARCPFRWSGDGSLGVTVGRATRRRLSARRL